MMMLSLGFVRLAQQNFLKVCSAPSAIKHSGFKRLPEIGRLKAPKLTGNYETGQLFLHKVFGYRGVVVFPWETRVYDSDIPNVVNTDVEPGVVEGTLHNFYQALIDARDRPFISAQPDAVTFLRRRGSSRSFYAIPGIDYVAHEDILPYESTDNRPIQHKLFEKFLMHQPDKDPPFGPKATLRAWQKKNHPWLLLSDVHRETTENVRVTVIPFYMGVRHYQRSSVYWWRYCIRVENLGEMSIQLRTQKFSILFENGTMESSEIRDIFGQEPVLCRKMPALQYSSHVSLQAHRGIMWGTFQMEREDGHIFNCKIPQFYLQSTRE